MFISSTTLYVEVINVNIFENSNYKELRLNEIIHKGPDLIGFVFF